MNMISPSLKIILIMLLSLLYDSTLRAQTNPYDAQVVELVKSTIDTGLVDTGRKLVYFELLKIERKPVKKAYDSIADKYNIEFKRFYEEQYTKEEIRLYLDFIKTPVGNKLSHDVSVIYSQHFPELNSLCTKLETLRKSFRDWQPKEEIEEANVHPDIDSLVSALNVEGYLEAVKKSEITRIEPKFEHVYIYAFDKMANKYIVSIKHYFRDSYSEAEITEALAFYNTPLGKKITKNSSLLIEAIDKANIKWIQQLSKLRHNITFGKYQREYFEEK